MAKKLDLGLVFRGQIDGKSIKNLFQNQCVLERGFVSDFKWIWEGFGGVLEASWDHFWKLFCHLEQKMEIVKNLEKPMVFH